MSSTIDSTFMATKMSASRFRAVHPASFARTVNHVGSPWMFDGNMFFPLTGIPIPKIDRIRIRFADWLPVPFEVATVIVRLLTMGVLLGPGFILAWPHSASRGALLAPASLPDFGAHDPFCHEASSVLKPRSRIREFSVLVFDKGKAGMLSSSDQRQVGRPLFSGRLHLPRVASKVEGGPSLPRI